MKMNLSELERVERAGAQQPRPEPPAPHRGLRSMEIILGVALTVYFIAGLIGVFVR
jgi:hypothetical protein